MKIRTLIRAMAVTVGAVALAQGLPVHAQQAGADNGNNNGNNKGGIHRAGPGKGGQVMQQNNRQGRGMMMARRRGNGPALAPLDTDDDGMLDLSEFLARHAAGPERMLERRDENGDGMLSREELEPRERPNRPGIHREAMVACMQEDHPEFGSAGGLEERFDTLDTDDNSLLDADELAAGRLALAEEQFERLDADGDGLLTQDELRANRLDRRDLGRSMRDCARDAAQSTTP